MAAIYTALFLGGLWIFPLFPAAPKLGPVYQNVTHMVPLWFPVLVIVPAFALDLLRAWMGAEWGGWKSALAAGFVFIAAFVAAQWPFADFLISPLCAQPIFGSNYFGFFDPANMLYNPYHFAHRHDSRRLRQRNDACARDLDHLLLARNGARQLDAQGPALMRP